MKTTAILSCLALLLDSSLSCGQAPTIENVVASPADYSGQSLTFSGATLSGDVLRYDLAGVRKYYLTVATAARTFEAGFFLAPPALADKLIETMNARLNYNVTLTFRVEQITINSVPQWHGIVTAVSFIGRDGKVIETLKAGRK